MANEKPQEVGPYDALAVMCFSATFWLLIFLILMVFISPVLQVSFLMYALSWMLGIVFTAGIVFAGSSFYGIKKLVIERAKYAATEPITLWRMTGLALIGTLLVALFSIIFTSIFGYLLPSLFSFLYVIPLSIGLGYILFSDLGKSDHGPKK